MCTNPEPIVIVNDFAFCKNHGEEYCFECFSDQKGPNNYRIMNDPTLADLIKNGYKINLRPSINVYLLGAVSAGGDASSETCKCTKHDTVDCKICFNWVEHISKDATEPEDFETWLEKRQKFFGNRDD